MSVAVRYRARPLMGACTAVLHVRLNANTESEGRGVHEALVSAAWTGQGPPKIAMAGEP